MCAKIAYNMFHRLHDNAVTSRDTRISASLCQGSIVEQATVMTTHLSRKFSAQNARKLKSYTKSSHKLYKAI